MESMDVARKLQLKSAASVAVVDLPVGVDLDLADSPPAPPATADAVLAFVVQSTQLSGDARAAIEAAQQDRLAWIAYPKAGGLGTDLNRDRLAAAVAEHGVMPVRQIAIDDTWSALRFRPGSR
jgi:hypothetical protein